MFKENYYFMIAKLSNGKFKYRTCCTPWGTTFCGKINLRYFGLSSSHSWSDGCRATCCLEPTKLSCINCHWRCSRLWYVETKELELTSVGKTTLGEALKGVLKGPWINFGKLRMFHLNDLENWTDASESEEALTYVNLVSMTQNYLKHGYWNIVVEDLEDNRVINIMKDFKYLGKNTIGITLVLSDHQELRRRIITRNEGWSNHDHAVELNIEIMQRETLQNEHKIDVSAMTPKEVLQKVLQLFQDNK